ncbi:expressed unknown protein [Seminavis robusta]|uniref:Uncharacterized protein n=1 Tax=Seminavis robusta TaxID=568900 RepID=A0A9N8EPA3_9STRA|nr:expressed unknown protein [Seminavis robusta]|eukprot:Sro1329_g263340.1 n/a (129) ;mRNA; f:19021-19529
MPSLFTPMTRTTHAEAAPRHHRGPNPMVFPKEGTIPITQSELRAQGVTFCIQQIQTQYLCLEKAREAYLAEGLDPRKGPEWYYFHLRMCFDTQMAANQCVIEHREKELRQRQKRIREKRLSSAASFSA